MSSEVRYIRLENVKDMNVLMDLYEKLQWRAGTSGLRSYINQPRSYPIVVAHKDNYSWYVNDNSNDRAYFDVNQVISWHMKLNVEKTIKIVARNREEENLDLYSGGIDSMTFERFYEHFRDNGAMGDNTNFILANKYRPRELNPVLPGRVSSITPYRHRQYRVIIKSVKYIICSTVESYEEIGWINAGDNGFKPNDYQEYFWEIKIQLPDEYEQEYESALIDSSLRVLTDMVDPNTFGMLTFDFNVMTTVKPTNYMYYTLL